MPRTSVRSSTKWQQASVPPKAARTPLPSSAIWTIASPLFLLPSPSGGHFAARFPSERRLPMAAHPSAQGGELKLETEQSPAGITVRCSGRITLTSVELLMSAVRPLIPTTKRIVLDLTDLDYLDSSGLGAIVRLWSASRKAGVDLNVINLKKRIKDLFSLTNLSSIFE